MLREPLFLIASGSTAIAAIAAGVTLAGDTAAAGAPIPSVRPSPSATAVTFGGSQTQAANGGGPTAKPQPSPGPRSPGDGTGSGAEKKTIALQGEVVGLYPGATASLMLSADNQNNFIVRLYQLTASVGTPVTTGSATPKAECQGSVIVVTPPRLPVTLPQNGGTVTVSVHMLPSATNDCRNATFPIRFTGKVDKL